MRLQVVNGISWCRSMFSNRLWELHWPFPIEALTRFVNSEAGQYSRRDLSKVPKFDAGEIRSKVCLNIYEVEWHTDSHQKLYIGFRGKHNHCFTVRAQVNERLSFFRESIFNIQRVGKTDFRFWLCVLSWNVRCLDRTQIPVSFAYLELDDMGAGFRVWIWITYGFRKGSEAYRAHRSPRVHDVHCITWAFCPRRVLQQ